MEKLYQSPFHYSQTWAVEKLRQYIVSKGGVITNKYASEKQVIIMSGNAGEEASEELKARHHSFTAYCSSWSGWQIDFDYEGYHYEIYGEDNPFFPVHVQKEKIGDEYQHYGSEFKAFSFHYGSDIDYSKEDPEAEYTPQIFDALIALPESERVVERKRHYYTEVIYKKKGRI